MNWLQSIPNLHRRDPEHRYFLAEMPFPVSVTGVLRIEKSDYAMERIQATTHIWAPRGHSTHRALEIELRRRFDPLLQSGRLHRPDVTALVSELDELRQGDYKNWVEPLITHPMWDSVQVIASERPTCCLMRRVAGTFDLAYTSPIHGVVLADLKTLGPNGSTYSTAAQLGAYMALEATWGNHYDAGQTIWATPGKTTFSKLYSRRECLLAWAAAWTRYKATQRHAGGFTIS